MSEKIALYLKENDEISEFLNCDKIAVYQKRDDWAIVDTFLLDRSVPDSMTAFRDKIRDITSKLHDCKIIAGGEMSGLPYSVFDRMGFHIFEVKEYSTELFDMILEDIKNGDEEQRMRDEIIKNARPVETSTPGVYFLDLITLQTECPEVSSKKALTAFLMETPFLELRLQCKHIPPWLEKGNYNIAIDKASDDIVSAVITKKNC